MIDDRRTELRLHEKVDNNLISDPDEFITYYKENDMAIAPAMTLQLYLQIVNIIAMTNNCSIIDYNFTTGKVRFGGEQCDVYNCIDKLDAIFYKYQ